jgi:hypothetical protein
MGDTAGDVTIAATCLYLQAGAAANAQRAAEEAAVMAGQVHVLQEALNVSSQALAHMVGLAAVGQVVGLSTG